MRELLGLVVELAGQTHVDGLFVAADLEQDVRRGLLAVQVHQSPRHLQGHFHVAVRQVVAGDLDGSLPDLSAKSTVGRSIGVSQSAPSR